MTLREAKNADPAIAVADTARDFYRAWADADVDRYGVFVDERTRWLIPGSSPIAGRHVGAAASEALRGRLGDFEAGITDVMVSIGYVGGVGRRLDREPHVTILARPNRRSDDAHAHVILIFHVLEDGKIGDIWIYPEDVSEFDAFVGALSADVAASVG